MARQARTTAAQIDLFAGVAEAGVAQDWLLVVRADDGRSILWDPREEQVIDILDAPAGAFCEEDEYWIEGRHGWVEDRAMAVAA